MDIIRRDLTWFAWMRSQSLILYLGTEQQARLLHASSLPCFLLFDQKCPCYKGLVMVIIVLKRKKSKIGTKQTLAVLLYLYKSVCLQKLGQASRQHLRSWLLKNMLDFYLPESNHGPTLSQCRRFATQPHFSFSKDKIDWKKLCIILIEVLGGNDLIWKDPCVGFV